MSTFDKGMSELPSLVSSITRYLLISNTFLKKQRQAEIGKKTSKAKQYLEAILLPLESYLCSSSTLSSINNRRYSKKICLFKRSHD